LTAAADKVGDSSEIPILLKEVDSALKRMDEGTYGLCERCHDPIEQDRLMADPLLEYCLDHLDPTQQRALEQDLSLASQIQNALLPRPQLGLPGWEVSYHYEPLGPVSGDYCDLVTTESGNLYFIFGDVSGKGVAASMLMARLHAIFRTLISIELPVGQLVTRANRLFCESTLADSYATLVCGQATREGEMQICNAGHCPPLLVRSGQISRLKATGLPIGLFSRGDYSVHSLELAQGDTFVLYTDGLSEARDVSGQEYGDERLLRLIRGGHQLALEALLAACLRDVSSFRAAAPRVDDLALMAIRRNQAAGVRLEE
jgi:sigma-B regulation protein RsbU (phosphoserine phosphatase)